MMANSFPKWMKLETHCTCISIIGKAQETSRKIPSEQHSYFLKVSERKPPSSPRKIHLLLTNYVLTQYVLYIKNIDNSFLIKNMQVRGQTEQHL